MRQQNLLILILRSVLQQLVFAHRAAVSVDKEEHLVVGGAVAEIESVGIGEFDYRVEHILKNLLQAERVGMNNDIILNGIYLQRYHHVIFVHLHFFAIGQIINLSNNRVQVEVGIFDLDFAGLNLRVVNHVVDKVDEHIAARLHHFNNLDALVICQVDVSKHVAVLDNGAYRVAHIVAQVGKERRFQPVGLGQLLVGVFHLLGVAVDVGNIARNAHQSENLVFVVEHRELPILEFVLVAVLIDIPSLLGPNLALLKNNIVSFGKYIRQFAAKQLIIVFAGYGVHIELVILAESLVGLLITAVGGFEVNHAG